MGEYASKYLVFIRNLHDKYIEIVNENKFLKVALDYFHDTQTKFVYSDEGFVSAMISMESLFNESLNDIKSKISHRAAFLIGLCGLDPEECFDNIKDLYKLRSDMVHGSGIPKKNKADRGTLSQYARRAIIIFLILLSNPKRRKISNGKRKDDLLKEIDYAMLIIEKRAILEKEINKKLSSFKLNIPRTFVGEGEGGKYRIIAW